MVQTLNLAQCKEYVRNIRDLELSCYQLERLQKKLRQKAAEPVNLLPQAAPIKKPGKKDSIFTRIIIDMVFVAVFAGIGALIGLIFGKPLMVALIVGGVILIYTLIWELRGDKRREAELKNYEKEQAQWEKKEAERLEKNDKAQARSAAVQEALRQSDQKLHDARDILKQYYDMNFIYPKYRGLVPISTIYEYLESGRCFSLVGPNGAYNLYESELRSNLILSKLDDVIGRLDSLSAGQQMLAKAIQDSNARIDRLGASLDRIEQNTAMSAYYDRITAANTDYLSWLATFR